jgi:hypothetical protein
MDIILYHVLCIVYCVLCIVYCVLCMGVRACLLSVRARTGDAQSGKRGISLHRHFQQFSPQSPDLDFVESTADKVLVVDVLEILYGGNAHGSNRFTKCVKLCCR